MNSEPGSPVILVLPGGGYEWLSDHEGEPVAEWLRGLGWRARVVRYPVGTRHPAPLDAVQAEIAAERAAGAAIVGVLGFSAGGHLAGLAALAPEGPRPDLAILCYPVVSMVAPTHSGSRTVLLGADASDDARRSTSLELLVTADAPPFFIWTTGDDASVPSAEHSHPLALALARAGVDHDFHVYANGGMHGIGLAPGTATGEAWTRACELWLRRQR